MAFEANLNLITYAGFLQGIASTGKYRILGVFGKFAKSPAACALGYRQIWGVPKTEKSKSALNVRGTFFVT